ncbi:MAG TPA: DegT/DnrJ/EryC1/StrS family aminotransferase [Mycobacteriales bacterium]|nr:DegT/DnrJ/EryC1/StrS family aminotransferase [Mycobacteriales bacterium]
MIVPATIPLAEPRLSGNEASYLAECVRSGQVSSVGPFVGRFERAFAAAVGSRHAVACASGTAALHIALRVAGAGPGDEVPVSSFTFIASANAISYTGARPLLVDSEPRTWNMDTQLLHDEVVRRVRRGQRPPGVVEVVHVLGHPADLEPLWTLRERFGTRILEDAAESLGAAYACGRFGGRQVGSVGDLGCFSFNGNKVITSGGGGMLVTDDAALADRARHLTTQAKLPGPGYVHDLVGHNYRLTNVAAALGLAQLEQLPAFLAAKRDLCERYDRLLAGLPVVPPPQAAWARPSHWLHSVLLEPASAEVPRVVDAMAAAGVQARPLWLPLHRQAPYARAPRLGGQVADRLHRQGLSLPSSVGLSTADQATVVGALAAALVVKDPMVRTAGQQGGLGCGIAGSAARDCKSRPLASDPG